MWIFTPFGFFSVTEPRDGDGDTLQVRARVRADLVALKKQYMPKLGKIFSHVGTDYPYRSFISKYDFAEGMAKIVLSIDYSNFKATVDKKQGLSREMLYMKVWQVMSNAEAKLEKMDASNQLVLGGRSTGSNGGEGFNFFEGYSGRLSEVPPKSSKKQGGVRKRKRGNS
jgi:hypothetical protein